MFWTIAMIKEMQNEMKKIWKYTIIVALQCPQWLKVLASINWYLNFIASNELAVTVDAFGLWNRPTFSLRGQLTFTGTPSCLVRGRVLRSAEVRSAVSRVFGWCRSRYTRSQWQMNRQCNVCKHVFSTSPPPSEKPSWAKNPRLVRAALACLLLRFEPRMMCCTVHAVVWRYSRFESGWERRRNKGRCTCMHTGE